MVIFNWLRRTVWTLIMFYCTYMKIWNYNFSTSNLLSCLYSKVACDKLLEILSYTTGHNQNVKNSNLFYQNYIHIHITLTFFTMYVNEMKPYKYPYSTLQIAHLLELFLILSELLWVPSKLNKLISYPWNAQIVETGHA